MYNQNEFYQDNNDNVIITDAEGIKINYGRLRLIGTESGMMFVTDLRNYGDVVEIFMTDSLSMEKFDGRANFKLTIEVGDQGAADYIRMWPVLNEDVDRLCRILTVATGKIVKVLSMARILAIYDGHEEKDKSHGLDHFYEDVEVDVLEATTWPRLEMTYDLASTILSESIRDELRDHAFGDKEIYWRDNHGHPVATGYSGYSGDEVGMCGFDIIFTEEEARKLVGLGTLGEVERNDSGGDEE